MPIVIRNAEVIAARDSSTFNPGTVDVVVYPPIPVDDWTHRQPVRPHRRGPPALPRHADGLAARRAARPRRCTNGRRPRRRRPAKKAPAKKTAAKKATATKAGREEDDRQEDDRHGSDEKGWRERPPVKPTADYFAPFTTTDDALVLASVASPAEQELLNDWLERQRREHPDSKVEVLQLPATTTRRQVCWRDSSPSSRPTKTGPSFRCGCSGCPAACPRARKWWPCCPAGTPTARRRCCSAASCERTHRGPGLWPASPRRSLNCASSGATPRSPKTPGNSRDSSSAAPSWRSNASSCACSGPSTSRRG